MWLGSLGSGLSALAIASLALICVSVSPNRALAELPSNCTKSAWMPRRAQRRFDALHDAGSRA